MEEACKRLIKNCIICWNYLYLSQKLEEIKDITEREAFLDAVAHGSAVPGGTSTCSVSTISRKNPRPAKAPAFCRRYCAPSGLELEFGHL